VSAEFQISLPNWPMARVLKEACAIWNAMRPDDRAHPEESEWPLLYNAVMTFLRHQHTEYDAALAAALNVMSCENRSPELRAELIAGCGSSMILDRAPKPKPSIRKISGFLTISRSGSAIW
jgi:hypothetical protein